MKVLSAGDFKINNTIINKHTATRGGILRSLDVTGNVNIDISNTEVSNNSSATSSFYYGRAGSSIVLKIENCLFFKNTATTATNNSGSSLIWLRQDNSGSHTAEIRNSTFIENTINTGRPLISRLCNVPNVSIFNSIFWNNTNGSGTTIDALESGATAVISHTLSNNGFASYAGATNILTSNPLFTDATNDDYTLQSSSPAKDNGDNTKVSATITKDLAGNDRIFNTTVDLGAYEYNATLSTQAFNLDDNKVTLYPNPAHSILNVSTKNSIENITIFNMLGAKVLETTAKNINVSGLQNGIYLVNITTNIGTTTKRFIKQ